MPESCSYNQKDIYCQYLRWNMKEDMLQSDSVSVKSVEGHRSL